MDKAKLDSVGIDYNNAIKRFGGNEMIYDKYLVRFPNDDHMANAMKALEVKDYNEILEQVHALKGIVATLGMDGMFNACNEVVKAVRAQEYDNMEALMADIQKEYDKVITIF